MFAMLKHLVGAFRFRFWSKSLPKHSRRPRANRHVPPPPPAHIATVSACWNACEVFGFCAALALGLLQLMALQFQTTVWQQHQWYLRTQSRTLPSERTVKQVLAPRRLKPFGHLAQPGLSAK